MTPEQQKFHDIKTTTDYSVCGYDVDYKVYVDNDNQEVVLQYEESDSNLDWLFNLLFIPFPLLLKGTNKKRIVWTTLGYSIAYHSTKNIPIREFIKAILKAPHIYKIVIRGWSFGSAMAKITDRHLSLYSGYNTHELTTYGDVKCWLNPFYKSKAKIVHEYTHPNDGVTYCVPFFFRDSKCKVGKFKLKDIFKSEYYHTHYDEYNYGRYE